MIMRKPLQHRGFSLLEIMIVLVIIGVGAGTLRLLITPDDPFTNLERAAGAFAFWFGHELDQALLNNREVGLYFSAQGVTLMHWREGDPALGETDIVWEAEPETLYADLPQDTRVELVLDTEANQWVALTAAQPEPPETFLPHLLVFPSEEYQPSFELVFSSDATAAAVSIVADGYNRPVVTRAER